MSAHTSPQIISLPRRFAEHDAQSLRDAVIENLTNGHTHLILSFEDVEIMDSSGITMLVSSMHKVLQSQGVLCIASCSETVSKVFHLTGLDAVLTIFDSCEDAVCFLHDDSHPH